MSYESYTKRKKIEKDSRKDKSYETCATRGERAMRKQNARRKHPLKARTLSTWASHMKHEGIWKP